MKIYGENIFKYPGTNRVIWDFEDGPFDTVNPDLIMAAKRLGYRIGELPEPPKAKEAPVQPQENKIEPGPESPSVSEPKRRGRPRKEAP